MQIVGGAGGIGSLISEKGLIASQSPILTKPATQSSWLQRPCRAEVAPSYVAVQSGDFCDPVDVSDQVCFRPDEELVRHLTRLSCEDEAVAWM